MTVRGEARAPDRPDAARALRPASPKGGATFAAWRRVRQIVQALAAVLFLYLFFGTLQDGATPLPHDLFFRLDPLLALAMLADRQWIPSLAFGSLTLVLTLMLGRVWCGWLCPTGAALDLLPLRHRRLDRDLAGWWRRLKHFVLFAIVFAALLGNLTLMVLDPITLLFRTLATSGLPALDFAVSRLEGDLYQVSVARGALEAFESLFRGPVLPSTPRLFEQAALIALVFAGVIALNAVRPRFWCRYLCPLGALLGLIARFARLRLSVDAAKCNACARCAARCPTGTLTAGGGFLADPAECTVCLNCLEVCPPAALTVKSRLAPPLLRGYDPGRRQVLASLGAAVVGVALLRSLPNSRLDNPWLVRPPGARENDLPSKCIRCGECIKVCPTAGLQPSLTTAGWEALWTPVLVARIGYCDYSCNACGQYCPTGAIPPLSLEEKRRKIIGLAYIDKNRCIPWADARDCIVCEEMCPLPQKAIRLESQAVFNARGESATVRLPHVIRDDCIGCGICETKCPVNGDAAIRIYVPNER